MVAQWQAELDRLADRDELEQKLAAAIQAGTPQRLEARVLWNAAALEEKLGALQKHIARLLLDGHTSEDAMRAEYGHVLTALPVFSGGPVYSGKADGLGKARRHSYAVRPYFRIQH